MKIIVRSAVGPPAAGFVLLAALAGCPGGETTTADAGTGGHTTTTSAGGGGAPPGAAGRDATAFVNAGVVAANAQYRMVLTLGQSAGAQSTMKGGDYRLEGGLVGATEVTP